MFGKYIDSLFYFISSKTQFLFIFFCPPIQHESATRSIDDNVWEEIRNFKKCLLMMFAKEEKGVIFLETVMGLAKQQRHCLVECIPLPRELAKQAPLYFKKVSSLLNLFFLLIESFFS